MYYLVKLMFKKKGGKDAKTFKSNFIFLTNVWKCLLLVMLSVLGNREKNASWQYSFSKPTSELVERIKYNEPCTLQCLEPSTCWRAIWVKPKTLTQTLKSALSSTDTEHWHWCVLESSHTEQLVVPVMGHCYSRQLIVTEVSASRPCQKPLRAAGQGWEICASGA